MSASPAEWGIAVGVSVMVIERLFSLVAKYRASAEERSKSAEDRGKHADDVIASQLTKTTDYSREDYLRLEKKVEAFDAKIDSKFETILTRLDYISRWESSLSAELKSWPAVVRRVDMIAHDTARNRDGLNEVRIKVGLHPIDQTPPFGVPIGNPSPHDVAGKKED